MTERLLQKKVEELLADHDPATIPPQAFLGARFDAGLAWVWFPEGMGGLGMSPDLQSVVERELAAAGAPAPDTERNVIGHGMAAPTIATHGTDEQRARYLRPLFTNEEIWCQLFSEPGAGSDLAALSARAVRDGDEWVVTGQKVWTTLGHMAKWGLLVARTDPSAVKHKGLTYFILDMHAAGVEVRPLRQITGDAEFNEVFMSEARIPESRRLGAVGEGWRVSLTTLMNERVAIGGGVAGRGSGAIARALDLWQARKQGGDGTNEAVVRDRVVRLWVEAEVNRLTNLRARQLRQAGTPGPEGSVGKLAFAELNQRIYELCVDLMGMDGTLYGTNYEMRRPEKASLSDGDERFLFLRARANSIEGGTSEIMRNILGERVLGLPGEPRVDKDRPWSEVPRS